MNKTNFIKDQKELVKIHLEVIQFFSCSWLIGPELEGPVTVLGSERVRSLPSPLLFHGSIDRLGKRLSKWTYN